MLGLCCCVAADTIIAAMATTMAGRPAQRILINLMAWFPVGCPNLAGS
jgi:hypothetical protein